MVLSSRSSAPLEGAQGGRSRRPCVNSHSQAPRPERGGTRRRSWRDPSIRRTSPTATMPTCDRSASSPSSSVRLGSCRTSRSRSASSAFDRHVHAHRPWMGRRRPRVLLVVADHHPGPDFRRPELLRAREPLPGRRVHLPVVEASLEPDARLVHRLVLLLGRRGHGDRRRRYGPVGPLEHLRYRPEGSIAAPVLQQPGVLRARDAHRHDHHQCERRPAPVDHQQHRGRRPRSSACSSSRWSCCCSSVSRTCRS